MSALVDMPRSFRAYAESQKLEAIDDVWKACFEWHVAKKKDVTEENWKRWVDREKTKVRVPQRVVQPTMFPKVERAHPEDPDYAVGLAAEKKIIDNLNAIGGTPVKVEEPAPRAPTDPICPKCGRLCSIGETQHPNCTALPKPETEPATLGDVLDDFIPTEDEHGSDEENDRDGFELEHLDGAETGQ